MSEALAGFPAELPMFEGPGHPAPREAGIRAGTLEPEQSAAELVKRMRATDLFAGLATKDSELTAPGTQ